MIDEKYDVEASPENYTFEFTSTGPKGDIVKAVHYTKIGKHLYNLAFGDKNPLTEEVSDIVVTNNGDSKKVLLTVAATLYTFTASYPDVSVFATGSTPARTRLYQIGITNNLRQIRNDFYIYGLKADKWEDFEPNNLYLGFLIQKKIKVL